MKEYLSERIRNVALVGHQGSGKTSLVEALLLNTGVINRMGTVEEGSTVSDYDEDERARGISLSTSLVPVEWSDYKINVLDTPGYTDFQGEVKNAIRVADAVILVVDAVAGVEVGTEIAFEYAKVYQQPIIVTINKMDRENANFARTLADLKESFPDYKFVPVMLPIGEQDAFAGVVNVMTQKAYYQTGKDRSDLPEEYADRVEAAHLELVEAAAEADDVLIEKYFSEGTLTNEEIREGMRKAAKSADLHTVPVFVSSGTKNVGTMPLLEALVAYTAPPTGRRVGVRRDQSDEVEFLLPPQSDEGPLAAYVFKTMTDRYVGTLNYFRLFSGSVTNDTRPYNASKNVDERLNGLLVLRGKEQLPVARLHVGDIGVVAKLNHTKTGDTFCDRADSFEILKPDFPQPLYAVAVNPKTQTDSAKMGPVLSSLCDADPTLRWRNDGDTGQVILEGLGELHVNTAIRRAEHLGVNIETSVPRVPYRETVTRKADATYRHKKQTGGAGQFGEVSLSVETWPDEEFVYETKIVGGAISQQFQASAEKGIRAVLPEGVIAGFPVVHVKVVVFDGKEHPVDSKDIAFQIAGREAFREAFRNAGPVLMEPIMAVQITVPESLMGDIMGDLNTRRGRVLGMDTVGNKSIVKAHVPYAEMMRYGNDLRSLTGGRGTYEMQLHAYEQVPSHLTDGIIAQMEAEKER
jgi:elongation factor G